MPLAPFVACVGETYGRDAGIPRRLLAHAGHDIEISSKHPAKLAELATPRCS